MIDLVAQLLGWAPLLLAGLAGTAYAWGAALTLVTLVMVLNVAARVIGSVFAPKTGR